MPPPFAGRYDLEQQIGTGGTGSVWRAYDRKHDRWVAVKVLTQSEAGTLLRFVREQSLRVQHPHVVAPQGWAADDEHIALSMDLVPGGSVETLLGDHGPLPETYVAVLLDQLLDGLAAIHRAGVVHRDVKPANLLLEPTGSERPFVRLADFGLAARAGEPRLTQRGHRVGTPGFVAPETATADPAPSVDIYSVGVLGRVLLSGMNAEHLPPQGNSALWPLLQQLSDPDPARRPTAQEVRRLLAPFVPPGTPWLAEPEPPYVFEQIAPPDVASGPQTQVGNPPTQPDHDPAARSADGSAGRRTLTVVMAASFTLAAILLVVVLVLLLR
ncbi:serine/threonine-protein kinase [Flexivirga sp. B27]